jgi:hypothetical protein
LFVLLSFLQNFWECFKNVVKELLHHPSILSTIPPKLVGISLGLIAAAPHPRFPVQSHILSAGGDVLTT